MLLRRNGFMAQSGGDPLFASVLVLLHGDGADASTTLTDNSANAYPFTAAGNAQIDTAQYVFGGASMLFDGTGDWWRADSAPTAMRFGTGAFCIEGWSRPGAVGANMGMLSTAADGGSAETTDHSWYMFQTSANKIAFTTWNAVRLTSTSSVSSGTWVHFAVSFDGTTYRIFINGTQEATYTTLLDFNLNYNLYIGSTGFSSGMASFNGHLDDIRITKGAARYTGNFSVPTEAYPNF